MSTSRDGYTVLFTGTPLPTDHTTHSSVNVDNDAIIIDADADHVISIKHTPGDGINVLTASNKDTGAITCRIDSDGQYVGNVLATTVSADTILYGNNNVETKITTLETTLNAATSADAGNTDNLVLRSVINGTEIDNLSVVARTRPPTASHPPACTSRKERVAIRSIWSGWGRSHSSPTTTPAVRSRPVRSTLGVPCRNRARPGQRPTRAGTVS